MNSKENLIKLLEKEGWNKLGFCEQKALKIKATPKRLVIKYQIDTCLYEGLWQKRNISYTDVWYDKSQNNACECLAKIKGKKLTEKKEMYSPIKLEQEIRHILLCEQGDDYENKISLWMCS